MSRIYAVFAGMRFLNIAIFVFKDGGVTETTWKHQSRSDSWTPEMKQAAREKTVKNFEERKK
jgi:hypothetical protein